MEHLLRSSDLGSLDHLGFIPSRFAVIVLAMQLGLSSWHICSYLRDAVERDCADTITV
jgi:hypothetical protein